MNSRPLFFAIIPVRYASTRFPGKPLARIRGKPMFWHVYQRTAKNQALAKTVLATDDPRIFQAAREYEVPVLMTGGHHQSGTERVFEAAQLLGVAPDSVVLNIQGDEPALATGMIDQLLAPFEQKEVQVSTLARVLESSEAERPDVVKVVIDQDGRALYFSRSKIPYQHPDQAAPPYLGHIGLYAYRYQTLSHFHALRPGQLERAEKLEQLRLLECGIPIDVVLTHYRSHGVDRPEDLVAVEHMMSEEQAQ